MFFDSHAHLSSDAIWPDIEEVVSRSLDGHVEGVINICTNIETLERGLVLSQKNKWIYNAASTTPHDVEKEGEMVFPVVKAHAQAGDLVAIGETGLDYHYHHSKPEIQKEFLRRYLQLALEVKLPVIIHCREAFADFFTILDEEYQVGGKHAPGVLHCFTGTIQEAEQVLKRGWFLSLSGIVTFAKSGELREVAKMAPLDQLLIETDSPYLAPQKHRGQKNEPAYVNEVAETIAQVKNLPIEQVAKSTSANAKKLFNLN